jgi:NitT/TauT family transport system substrate-binding protein
MVYLPTTLASQLGHFKSEGTEVTIEDTGAGSKSLQALLGGSTDVVTGFYDHTIQMAAEGKQVKAFVTLTRYPGAVLLCSPEAAKRIRTVADLKGAIAGVTAPGSSSHFFLNHLLVRHGLSAGDVRIVAMGGGRSRVAAVENSKVDVGVMYEPSVTFLLRRAPGAKVLADARTSEGVHSIFGTAEYPSAVLYTTASWLAQNQQSAQRIARAMLRTLSWIKEHTPRQIAEQMPASFHEQDPEGYTAALERSKSLYSPDGIMHHEAAEVVRQVLELSLEKVRAAKVNVASTYTNEFLITLSK